MKRIWSLLLILLLIPCLVMVASAKETSGTCGKNLTWVFEDTTGTLTISGTGSMDDFYYEHDDDRYSIYAPWTRSALKTVIIEEGVTSIGSGAFCDADALTEVVFPDSLTTIGYWAFESCSSLTKVTLPNNNVQINVSAFSGAAVSIVEIPANMMDFPVAGFINLPLTAYIVNDDNPVYSSADGILFSKDQTELIACPRKHTFADNHYTVPDSVTAIGENAFYDCTGLYSITIPDSVSTIGAGAFGRCWYVNSVHISDLTQWMRIRFDDVYANPMYDGANLYLNGTAITDLVIPDGTTAIGNYTFYGMKCPGSLTIPSSVTSIAASAFDFYTAPEAVHISDISAWAKIRFDSQTSNPVANGSDLYVNGELLTELVLPDGITAIRDYAFSNCDTLTSITLPDSVTSIGNVAFCDCAGLTSVFIPDSVTTIGRSAFEACTNLTDIRLPKSLTALSSKIFKNCWNLTSVSIPDSVTSIGDSAFERCYALTDIQLPKSLTALNSGIFSQCSSLTSVTLPQTVTSIGDSAFEVCSALTSVNIPEGVTSIGSGAFRKCRKLTSITIPDSVTSIGSSAFAYCSGLTKLDLSTGLKELGSSAFYECNRIKELDISGAIGTIPARVAYNCISLERVTMGEGITYIDSNAFEGCTKLKSVTIPSTVKKIYRDAFENCTALTDFYLQDIKAWIDLKFLFENFAEEGEGLDTYYSYDRILGLNEEPKNLYLNGKKITDLVIPEGVKNLDPYVFRRTTIKSVTIPGSLTYIPGDTFSNCASLERIVFTSGTKNIGADAFSGCKKLESISIPSSVTYVGKNAFYGCTEISKVYYGGSKTQRGKIDIRDGNTRLENATWEYNCNLDLDAPVISVTGVASSGKNKVTWSKVEGAERYRVYRATSKSGSYSYLGYTSALSYTDTTAKAGTNYYYKVTAFDADTQSASLYSNIVNRCCDLKKPVVTLKVDTASGKPKVTWEKISGAEKYYIVRATSEKGTYSKVATVTGTSYIDKETKAGKTYYYKVKALHAKDAADSAYSAVVSRVCDLKKPVVTITRNSSGNPWLKWDAISGAEKYEVYRATSENGTYKLVKTTTSATSFADKTATAGRTYYYKVRAIHENAAANSAYSAVKYIKAQ